MSPSTNSTDSETSLQVYSVDALFDLPEPEWQIDRIFETQSRVVIYGESASGKSFLALDFALSIACGKEWLGRAVTRGAVVYVAGEGGRSIRKRVSAWMQHNGVESVDHAFFVLEGIQVHNPDAVEELVARLADRQIAPILIVLDTLARCFVGGDENSTQQMGEFVAGLEVLLRKTKATVMVVHHSGKDTSRGARGSNSLKAAVDVEIQVSKDDDDIVTVKNTKQKDEEEFESITLQMQQIQIVGSDLTSCVLMPCEVSGEANRPRLVAPLRKTLMALSESPEGIASTQDWWAKAAIKERTFHNHRTQLLKYRYVKDLRRGEYQITDSGKTALGIGASEIHAGSGARGVLGTAATAKSLQLVKRGSSPSITAATATTPVRGVVAAEVARESPGNILRRKRGGGSRPSQFLREHEG